MKTFQTDLPTLYGDHHVVEVRRIISELPGVSDLYVSSAFQYLQVEYDETKTNTEAILTKLEDAGYLGELLIPQESNMPATELIDEKPFRHTAAFEQTRQVSFHRETNFSGRPLWPCPGMGTLSKVEENNG